MSPPPPGLFVTLEGADGVGKTTQTRLLAAALRAGGRAVVETREPGGTPGAESVRALLLDPGAGWSAVTEALLFTAARRDHVERVIDPALAAGAVVVCDRFVDSTRAYQGLAGREMVDTLHRLAIGRDPDLTLVLETDAAAQRRADRAAAEDRFETRGTAFQDALRAAFRAIVAAEPGRCVLIDADGAPDTVAARVWAAVAPRLGR